MWQGQRDSNPQPTVLETVALSIALCPYLFDGSHHPCDLYIITNLFGNCKGVLQIFLKKDFGAYVDKQTGELHVAFLSNNDITGGNSGSPIFNAKGELIGLAFDGNWEAMSGDIVFEPDLQRTINVDVRYVLWVMEKVGGAQRLINELTIEN